MKLGWTPIFLTELPVRWLGVSLAVVGVIFPIVVLVFRAAHWQPAVEPAEESLDLELVVLQKGTFLMGSPKAEAGRFSNETLHQVEVRSFAASRTEITQGQYQAVMGENPVETGADFTGASCSEAGVGGILPVVCVDWFDAIRFCNGLSIREGLEPAYVIQGEEVIWDRTGPGYRLLTEAEWEYAARAGTSFTWVGTDKEEEVCEFSNVADAAALEMFPGLSTFLCNDGFPNLAPVDAFKANRYLLSGLGGNAAEWVWDAYDAYPEKAGKDPSEDPAFTPNDQRASYRVIRGGSWGFDPRLARVAVRVRDGPSGRYDNVGFRVARSLPSAL